MESTYLLKFHLHRCPEGRTDQLRRLVRSAETNGLKAVWDGLRGLHLLESTDLDILQRVGTLIGNGDSFFEFFFGGLCGSQWERRYK